MNISLSILLIIVLVLLSIVCESVYSHGNEGSNDNNNNINNMNNNNDDLSLCSSNNPLLVWSNSNNIVGKNGENLYFVDSVVDIKQVINMLLYKNQIGLLSLFDNDNENKGHIYEIPSVIIGFVFNSVDGIDISQSKAMKNIIVNDITSSLIVSFVKQDSLTEDNDLIDQFFDINGKSNTIFTIIELDGTKSDIVEKVKESINKKNVVILIKFNKETKLADVDNSVISNIQAQLKNIVTEGKYMSFISSRVCNQGSETLWNGREKEINNRRLFEEFVDTANNGTFKVRTKPEVLTGMVSTLLLGLVLLSYFCCMHDIQAGSSFASKYPAKGKEFN